MLPVSPACVSSPFGPRVLPGRPKAGTYHYGIDLPAPAGAVVRPAAAGAAGAGLRAERACVGERTGAERADGEV